MTGFWKEIRMPGRVIILNCNYLNAFVVLFLCTQWCMCEYLIQSVSGVLYAENITFYRLSGDGALRLELHSLEGDADLYVSSHVLQPSYIDNELKSESCGLDVVDVPSTYDRPIGIGIYGNPSQPYTVYKLDIYFVTDFEIDEYEKLFRMFHYYDYDQESKGASDSKAHQGSSQSKYPSKAESSEEESVWWTILVTVLKFLLEVIV